MTDYSSPVDGSTRGGRIQLQRWRTGPTPCPPQRCTDRLTPPRPALQPHRTRATHVELLRLQILSLDRLLISTRGPLRHRRVRWEPRAGVSAHRCPSQPLASHRHARGIPICEPTAGLLIAQPLRRHPQRSELSQRDPQISRRNPRDIRSRHIHIPQGRTPGRHSKRTTNHHRQVKRLNRAATAEICAQGRAGQALQRTRLRRARLLAPSFASAAPHHKGPSAKHLVRPSRGRCAHTRSFPAVPWWRASTTMHRALTAAGSPPPASRGQQPHKPITPPAKETNR